MFYKNTVVSQPWLPAGKHRPRPRFRRLGLEPLERRELLACFPELLQDVNLHTVGSGASQFVDVSGITFFVANDRVHGHELWRTDGTRAGTTLVKDIDPGSGALAE